MKITFYCKVDKSALDVVEFYKQDIDILKEISSEFSIATKYREIDWTADIIFVWWWTYAFVPVLIGRLLNKKIIITGTFNYRCPNAESDYFKRNWVHRTFIKFSIMYSNKNILVSKNEYNEILNDWKLTNLEYSPHTVDTMKYRPINKERKSNIIFTICWTGKGNIKRKCLPELIDAVEIVIKERPDLKFIIAGTKGDGYDDLFEQIKMKGLINNISLIGKISEKEKIYYLQNCAIYLQPSKYEGFGLAIAEAMSCGAPIISSDVGEVKNVVGNAGLLLDSCSPAEISQSINYLLNNKEEAKKLGFKARKKISTEFPLIRRRNDLERIIKEIYNNINHACRNRAWVESMYSYEIRLKKIRRLFTKYKL